MLKISNMSAAINGKKIIENINAEFETGKVNVLAGPNGCGKSTLLRTILQLIKHEDGSISIDGQNVLEFDPKRLAQKIAYMPQSRNSSDITVRRLIMHGRFPYLSYPRKYRKCDREIVDNVMAEMGISDLAHRSMSELSGGQRQRVYIAMALAQETGIVLMDEPTTYLDIHSQLDVIEIVKTMAAKGKNVILVLHDFESILNCADVVYLMDKGHIIKSGCPEEILASKEAEDVFGVKVNLIKGEDGNHCYVTRR